MKVFLVLHYAYNDQPCIIGVATSREKAEEMAAQYEADWWARELARRLRPGHLHRKRPEHSLWQTEDVLGPGVWTRPLYVANCEPHHALAYLWIADGEADQYKGVTGFI